MNRICILLPAFILVPVFCFAAIINVPTDQPTIQAGIDAALEGDTVLIAPYTYSGSGNNRLHTDGKAIVVKGEAGPEATIIDCEDGVGYFCNILTSEDSNTILEDLTFTNGQPGISISKSTPQLINLHFIENIGAGISDSYSGESNKPAKVSKSEGVLLIQDCRFIDNQGRSIRLCCPNFQIEMRNCYFKDLDQAGIYMDFNSGLYFYKCNFVASGIYTEFEGQLSMDSCSLVESFTHGNVEISNSSFDGGEIAMNGKLSTNTKYTATNCAFTGFINKVFGDARLATISDCVIHDNPGQVVNTYNTDISPTFAFTRCKIIMVAGFMWGN